MTKSQTLISDLELAEPIRLILSDVDGVLTSGAIIYDSSGNETKAFHVRDGLGIKMWQRAGYTFGIITARKSEVVSRRAAELGIEALHQGAADKWAAAEAIMHDCGCTPEQTCYIGDDLPDLTVMQRVRLPIAVADAALDVRESARWITQLGGGQGAVRELIERLLRTTSKWNALLSN